MRIYDFLTEHPDDHIRIIRYEPAPDIMNDRGELVCGGEGTSTVVFDSTTGAGDIAPDLMLEFVSTSYDDETDDGDPLHIVEYIPDEPWY